MCPHPATCGVCRPTSVHHRVADLRDQGLDRRICLCHRVCMSLRQTVEFMTPNRHALQPIHPALRKWSASRLARRSILPTGRVIRRARWPRTPAGVAASPDCLSPSAASLRNPLEGPADRSGARRGAGIEWRGVADKSSAIARESRHPGGRFRRRRASTPASERPRTPTRTTLPRAESATPWKRAPPGFSRQLHMDQCSKRGGERHDD